MKRLLSQLVAFACLATPAVAAPALTAGDVSGPAGATVLVPFTFTNDSAVSAIGFDVLFDAAKISAVGAAVEGAALAATNHDVHSNLVSPGRFRVIVLSSGLATLPPGEIVVVPFTLAEDAVTGAAVALALSDVEMVKADATVIGGVLHDGSVTVQLPACPVPGDIAPDGVGSGTVTLLDFAVARRKALGSIAQNDRDALCGNVGPGDIACVPQSGKISYCPTPNTEGSPISLIDVVIIRRLALQTYQIACAACESHSVASVRVAGDAAPRGLGNGLLDIGDVVFALRASVGLEADGPDTALADVAPARRADDVMLAEGNGIVDIGDVVLLLRGAVGLESLTWPEREIDVRIAVPEPRVAFAVRVAGWPAHSTVLRVEGVGCSGDEAGLDVAGERWGLACVSDPGVTTAGGTVATVTHVGPRVSISSLSVESTVLTPDLREVGGLMTLAER